jgi:hypothetical protein
MDSRTREQCASADAADFVRFCYRRRRVGWPELYDEMCAVASRGLFRGWGTEELSDHGVRFTLFEMPSLAALVTRIVAEEHELRALSRATVRRAPEPTSVSPDRPGDSPSTDAARDVRLAAAPA